MDLITLAMAKAYTDKKVSGGGGGGSGLPFVQIETPLVGVGEFTALSGAESAALTAAASGGVPVVVSVSLAIEDVTSRICSVVTTLEQDGNLILIMPAPQDGDFHGVILFIMGDAWSMTYVSGSGYSE